MENNDYLDYLYHHGIKDMHWGVLRYQNEDGSLTPLGRIRYGVKGSGTSSFRTSAANLIDNTVTKINRTTRKLNNFNDKVSNKVSSTVNNLSSSIVSKANSLATSILNGRALINETRTDLIKQSVKAGSKKPSTAKGDEFVSKATGILSGEESKAKSSGSSGSTSSTSSSSSSSSKTSKKVNSNIKSSGRVYGKNREMNNATSGSSHSVSGERDKDSFSGGTESDNNLHKKSKNKIHSI